MKRTGTEKSDREVDGGAKGPSVGRESACPTRGSRLASADHERGVALLLTLLMLSILIVLVSQLTWTAQVDRKLAQNARDDLKMQFGARGALAYVRAVLRADRADPETAKVDSVREDWTELLNQPVTIGDVSLELQVEDCERRLNVNLLTREATKAFAAGVLRRLVARLELDQVEGLELDEGGPEAIADRIIDYVDADDEGDYEDGAKNAPLLGPEELLGIPGIPDEVWFGSGEADTEETDSGVADMIVDLFAGEGDAEEPRPGLITFLTAWGSEKVNLNTCSLDLFAALIPPKDAKQREIDLDQTLDELERFRTGGTAEEPAPEPEEGQPPPGEDFQKVEDLSRKITTLRNIFPAGRRGGGGSGGGLPSPSGGGAAANQGPLPKDRLTVVSQDFTVSAQVTREGMTRRFEGLLRRGRDQFYVLMWREITR